MKKYHCLHDLAGPGKFSVGWHVKVTAQSYCHIFADYVAFYGIPIRPLVAEKIGAKEKLTDTFLSPPCWKVTIYMRNLAGPETRAFLRPRDAICGRRLARMAGAILGVCPFRPIVEMLTSCIPIFRGYWKPRIPNPADPDESESISMIRHE